ncbi:hypothetical protein GCM10011514_02300 [Emticicia aquatilis]|uniref:Peptidase S1 domain-containing protein n=1 Tax=Emticicia aquatilis TaxID=1537369 RepID=A0A916YEN9_9BACT|nr:trypsin-like serine protease [Emticicia aquatilis]GGD41847.1 hypothetical protein GCM10011514_02300 [Emticicia aquatilis]
MSKYFLFIFFLISQAGFSQIDLPHLSLDQISTSIVVLYDNECRLSGTGTLISHDNRYFIITAKHVASNLSNHAQVVFSFRKDSVPIKIDIIFISKNLPTIWTHHPKADISSLEVEPINKDWEQFLLQIAINSIRIPKSLDALMRGDETYFYGFPNFDINSPKISPVSFSAEISSIINSTKIFESRVFESLQTNEYVEYFYLDKPSMQGASGSSVFVRATKSGSGIMRSHFSMTAMIGVITHTHSDNTGGKLGVVMPCYYIWDLISK